MLGAVASWSMLCLLLLPAAARADWRVVHPPAGVLSVAVADPDTWLVERPWGCCAPSYDLTVDAGASWTSLEVPGFVVGSVVGAAADGTFRIIAWRHTDGIKESQVFKVGQGALTPVGPVLVGEIPLFDSAAVDGDGATWIPRREPVQDSLVLSIVAADGSLAEIPLPDFGGTYGWEADLTVRGMRLLRFQSDPSSPSNYHYVAGTLRLGAGNELVPAEPYPVSLEDGEWLASSRFGVSSWDGGAHWAEAPFSVVERASAGEMPRYLRRNSVVVERHSSFLFRATGLDWPDEVPGNYAVDSGSSLVAWKQDAIYVHDLPLPPRPRIQGDLPPDTQRMLARADLFRADAGLPPLVGDGRISAAARNHSTYTTLNPTEASSSAHQETSGSPGFTGVAAWDRCEAVGTTCNSEVIYSPGVSDPVGGWLATIYHRPLLGSPVATVVGAAEVPGGWAVANGGADENLLVAPFGYPVGRWRGDPGFSGEFPDPVSACRYSGQNVDYPLGIAVSLYLPSDHGHVSRLEVRRRGSPIPLPGCLLQDYDGEQPVGVFLLDDPLVPGATYDASAQWNPGFGGAHGSAAGPDLGYDWSFNFDPDSVPGVEGNRGRSDVRCRPLRLSRIKSVAKKRRGRARGQHLGVEEMVVLKQKGKVRLRRARLYCWTAGVRHRAKLDLGRLRGKPVTVGKTSYLRLRVPESVAREIEPGEAAELVLSFTGRRLRGCPRGVRLSSDRKIQFGWIHLRGSAAWVSKGRR